MYLSGFERNGIAELSSQGIFQIEDSAADGEVHAGSESERGVEKITVFHLTLINAPVKEQVGERFFPEKIAELQRIEHVGGGVYVVGIESADAPRTAEIEQFVEIVGAGQQRSPLQAWRKDETFPNRNKALNKTA